MQKWYKRFPYPGWLAVFLVFLGLCMFLYHKEKQEYTSRSFHKTVQEDFSRKEADVDRDYKAGLFQQILHQEQVAGLTQDYFLFLTRNGRTFYWNTTMMDLPAAVKEAPDSFKSGRLSMLSNGSFYIRTWLLKGQGAQDSAHVYAYTVIPVFYDYTIENQYFQSRFAADARIPVFTVITTEAGKGGYAILDKDKKPVFYLRFGESAENIYTAGPFVWLLAVVTFLCLAFWVHELCHGIGVRTRKPTRGWYALVLIVLALQVIHNKWDFPAGFLNSKIFSPELLSSGTGVHSLGDFIIDVLMDFWIFVYLLAYVPLSSRRIVRNRLADKIIRVVMSLLLVTFLYNNFATEMRMLVIDSKISFEVSDFRGLTVYTFAGIFALSVITINFLIALGIINALVKRLSRNILPKYVLLVVMSLLVMLLLDTGELKVFHMVILFMSIAGMLLIDAFGLPMQKRPRQYDLSIAPTSYLWFAILCSWITLEIFYFNYSKEKDLRKVFAAKQQQQDDDYIRYSFADFADNFQQDTTVQAFFRKPSAEMHTAADKYIFYNYLVEYSRKYSIALYYYDAHRKPLRNRDSTDITFLHLADSIVAKQPALDLVNMERATGGSHMYWLWCPVPDPASRDTSGDMLGYVGFDVSIDKRPKMMNRRSFLGKKNNPTDQHYFDKYAYGIYRNHILWTQAGNHIFPYLDKDGKDTAEFTFRDSLNTSVLLYRPSKDELIKVIYNRNLLTSMISLFSYVLAVLLVLTGCVFLVRQFLFYPVQTRFFLRNFNFTIRSKVNLTILITVFASLVVVGVITLTFLGNKYKENQRKSLQNLLLYYSQNILHYSEENHLDFSAGGSRFLSRYPDLSYKLNAMAEEQGADINLYDPSGKMLATSQLELLKKGLLSHHMQREAYLALSRGDQSELFLEDRIGDLSYQSIYTPLRDKNDHIFAYVNLPYYASQTELNDEISNVLASLINVYALIFFLSGICAILISNSIIRSFRLLIGQFSNIRLRHNEYIHWPYKDEIGVLVRAYNAMMKNVEGMAAKLARTEREAAWREIARQVAHEIKNPLTPMKLNIQYLQQAIDNGRPDINDLAARVSATLIEQIENLNLIASEFSSFAKMPEAAPELLDVREALLSMVTLFQKSNVQLELKEGRRGLCVYMDKSYFIRVFTNLIQNAIQAVDPENGEVLISYEQKESNVVIMVKDNGSGIAAELQEKLFVPYFTTKSSGTGLGLPMTRNMIEHSGGSVWFTTVIDEGSVFYVQLPLSGQPTLSS